MAKITATITMSPKAKASLERLKETMAEVSEKLRAATDPWVVVGTTTIDGTIEQVAAALLYNSTTNDDVENNVGWIDSMVSTSGREPWEIGGRHLRARGSHINLHTGTALIRCDIVRRRSDIDAELNAHEQAIINGLMRVHMDNHICPECGPHGNRGRVALAFSEVACTTCAGGMPGDAFGRVAQFDGLEVNEDTFAVVDEVLQDNGGFTHAVITDGDVVDHDGMVVTLRAGQVVGRRPLS